MSSKIIGDNKDEIPQLNIKGDNKIGSKKSSVKSKNVSKQPSEVNS